MPDLEILAPEPPPEDGYDGLAPLGWPRERCRWCCDEPVPVAWMKLHRYGLDPDSRAKVDRLFAEAERREADRAAGGVDWFGTGF